MNKFLLTLVGTAVIACVTGLTACGHKSENNDSQQAVTVDAASDDSEAEVKSSDDENVDRMLGDYEKFVNSYSSISQKAGAGDAEAQAECDSLMTKAQLMSEKLDKLASQMAPAQQARFAKILDKLNEAVSNIALE